MPEQGLDVCGSRMRTAEMREAQGMDSSSTARPGLGFTLIAAGTLCLVAAGGLMWWRRGAAVFEDIASAALAWCF